MSVKERKPAKNMVIVKKDSTKYESANIEVGVHAFESLILAIAVAVVVNPMSAEIETVPLDLL